MHDYLVHSPRSEPVHSCREDRFAVAKTSFEEDTAVLAELEQSPEQGVPLVVSALDHDELKVGYGSTLPATSCWML